MRSNLRDDSDRSRVSIVLAAVVVTLALATATRPEFTGDAFDYARDAASAPSLAQPDLYEPGHLLWRPVGVVLRDLAGRAPGSDPVAVRETQRSLNDVSTVAAVVMAAAVGLYVEGLVASMGAGLLAVALTAFGAAVINFAQAGSSYVAGIALVCAALWLGTLRGAAPSLTRMMLAGALLALGVLVWLPYVLAVPSVLLATYLLPLPDSWPRWRAPLVVAATCATIGIVAYYCAASVQGIGSIPDFLNWLGSASHGIARPGLSRVVIGLPRSFVHMGSDGREVKRYLLGDSLNPVSGWEVARLHVWPRLLVFYGVIAGVVRYAVHSSMGRRLLYVFLVALVPVAGLGAVWSGGEVERYLALYPFLLPLIIWAAWFSAREGRLALPAAVGVFSLLLLGNLWAFNPWVGQARSVRAQARLGCLVPTLNTRSMIIVPEEADPLVTFTRDRLDEPPRSLGVTVRYLIPPVVRPDLAWDGVLSALIDSARSVGGGVWVPAYVLDRAPPRWSGWVEGAQDVSWSEVRSAFANLSLRQGCAGTELLEVVAP